MIISVGAHQETIDFCIRKFQVTFRLMLDFKSQPLLLYSYLYSGQVAGGGSGDYQHHVWWKKNTEDMMLVHLRTLWRACFWTQRKKQAEQTVTQSQDQIRAVRRKIYTLYHAVSQQQRNYSSVQCLQWEDHNMVQKPKTEKMTDEWSSVIRWKWEEFLYEGDSYDTWDKNAGCRFFRNPDIMLCITLIISVVK